jgi:diguanylate cyclase (GGDEF)-like protein
MLTSTDDLDSRLKSLEQGASDYLTKPFDAAELVARVKIHFKIKRLQDDLVSANKHFKQLSNIDPLTNLYNRRFFTEIIDAELQRTSRLKSFLSLLIVDIDRFKEINDSYGHQVGDEVLLAVADKLSEALRTYDIASRYGGDEFVIVLPNTQLLSGLEVAERIRKAVQSINFKVPLGKLSVTVSIGIAAFPTEKVDCYNALFTGADAALYRAKHNGRNRVEADEDGTTLDHQKATCSEDQT